jgi:hypothetical protein
LKYRYRVKLRCVTGSVADPDPGGAGAFLPLDPGAGAFLTPGSGSGIWDGKKSRSMIRDLGSEMNIPDLIFEKYQLFLVKNAEIL